MNALIKRLKNQINSSFFGKTTVTDFALAALMARGHILIEDLPGRGKTTLAKTLATMLGLKVTRVQCTSDLLPSDIIGNLIWSEKDGDFRFRQGPIFTDLLFLDELNRASPRTQSACLQPMEESQVAFDNQTYQLSPYFTVIATQNPQESQGTFPLPESQLDRFMVRLEIGPLPVDTEKQLMHGAVLDRVANQTSPLTTHELNTFFQMTEYVNLSPKVVDYAHELVSRLRVEEPSISVRAAQHFAAIARAWAALAGRDFVIPEDFSDVATAVFFHRLHRLPQHDRSQFIDQVVRSVVVP